ncbi:MAG: MFS transporter [Actinomycetota bacterium]|nr:MFS transporter [Actinomycetota bacterium]
MTIDTTSIGRRLDSLPWTRVQTMIALGLGAGWLFDSLEVNLVGSVINPLEKHFGAGPLTGQFVFFSWLVGILVGALAGGRLADRFGRRRLFVATLLWYATFTVLTGLSPSIYVVIVLRFLTGLGVGAEYSIINSAIAELMPARHRGKAGAAVMNFWPVGAIASGLLAYWLLNTLKLSDSVSWRYGFALGGVLALVVLIFRRRLPESPRWLASQGRAADAEAVVADLERRSGVSTLAPVDGADVEVATPTFGAALRELVGRYPGRLALGCLLDLSEAFGYYGIFALLSLVVLPAINIPAAQIPFFFIMGNVGALAGGLTMTALFDRLGRRRTVLTAYSLAAAGVVLLAAATATKSGTLVLLAFMVSNAFATAAWTTAYPTFTELFPTHLRGAGVGMSVAVGRVGAAFGVLLVTTIAQTTSFTVGYALVIGFWLLGVVAMVVFSARGGPEAARRPLELVTAGGPALGQAAA